jgi:hypothetical protein
VGQIDFCLELVFNLRPPGNEKEWRKKRVYSVTLRNHGLIFDKGCPIRGRGPTTWPDSTFVQENIRRITNIEYISAQIDERKCTAKALTNIHRRLVWHAM